MATTHRLEISFDPLSDLTPAWTDLSSRLLEVPSVKVGVDDDLSEMQAGSATFRLDNRDRALEPGYAAGTYYPNVRPLRRIRYFIDDGVNPDWPIFHGYIVSWGPVWPGGMNQEAIIQAVDGSVILEMDTLPVLDPPTATSYEEVVMFDKPFGFYTGNDVDGTQLKAETGPDMVIVGRPLANQPSLVTGDPGFSMRFGATAAVPQYARAAIQSGQFGDTNKISAGGWFRIAEAATETVLMKGPEVASTDDAFVLKVLSTGEYEFQAVSAAGLTATATSTTTADTGRADFVMGTWDGQAARIYVNGVLEDTTATPLTIGTGTADLFIYISTTGNSPPLFHWQKAEFHETCLPPERVLARWEAGSNGFPAQPAGERIADTVLPTLLMGTTDIDTGYHEVMPVMSRGQSRMEAVKDAVRAEFPSAMFYFPGSQDPRYLGWNYGDTAPYNTSQVTVGNNPGEVPFADIETTDDDELYNVVTVAREGGLAQTAMDADSEAEFFRRAYELTGLIHVDDMGCQTVAAAILADHSQPDPPVRVKSVTLTSDNALALAEILERTPGDLIRVKHRPKGGTAIDIITRIRGRTLTVAPLDGGNRVISATWTLGRGFNAAVAEWRLGIVGYTELNSTAVLG
jgi:hypothetical protein